MLQGTGSDVGKSLLVAGLARAFTARGLNVRPFKPQNMSNNAAVTADGGEIGRAQALQARACRIEPLSDMNPVLLKPQSETGAQVVVQGKAIATAAAADYQALKPTLMPRVLESFARIGQGADLVLVEGAGSAAEVNLRAGDIANMGFAEAAGVPVVLVGDIDRGGVIASLVGTHALLQPTEAARIKGYIINKFRGDPKLFAEGVRIIGRRTGWECLGVVPWFAAARSLPAEDAVALEQKPQAGSKRGLRIVVPQLSRIANFDDFDPLAAEPGVSLEIVAPGKPLPVDADLVILPGSKSTIADLAFLRAQGWDIDILAHHRQGKPVLGICAGYQMLGQSVHDPEGIEGPPGSAPGLGLLAVETIMGGTKTLLRAEGFDLASGQAVQGYEMHMGATDGPDRARPMLRLGERADGARSADGLVSGCYLHGLFGLDGFRHAFLASLGHAGSGIAFEARIEAVIDDLAAHVARHVDLDRLLEMARA